MVAFLDCVQQFKEEVEKGETRFCLPYRWVLPHRVSNWHLVLPRSSGAVPVLPWSPPLLSLTGRTATPALSLTKTESWLFRWRPEACWHSPKTKAF